MNLGVFDYFFLMNSIFQTYLNKNNNKKENGKDSLPVLHVHVYTLRQHYGEDAYHTVTSGAFACFLG